MGLLLSRSGGGRSSKVQTMGASSRLNRESGAGQRSPVEAEKVASGVKDGRPAPSLWPFTPVLACASWKVSRVKPPQRGSEKETLRVELACCCHLWWIRPFSALHHKPVGPEPHFRNRQFSRLSLPPGPFLSGSCFRAIRALRNVLVQRVPGLGRGLAWATMAGHRFSVPRFEGVSQEQFIEHLYPQVRPSPVAEPRDVGGYLFLPLERLRTGFLGSRLWREGCQFKVASWPCGQGSTWGMLTVSSIKFFGQHRSTFLGSSWTSERWLREIFCLISPASCLAGVRSRSLIPLRWHPREIFTHPQLPSPASPRSLSFSSNFLKSRGSFAPHLRPLPPNSLNGAC